MKLSVKLPAVAVSTVLAAALIGGTVAVREAESSLRDQVIATGRQSAAVYLDSVAGFLDRAATALEATAGDAALARLVGGAVQGGDREAGRVLARRVLAASAGQFEHIVLLAASGDVVLSESETPGDQPIRRNLAYAAWFQKAMRTGDVVVSDLTVSAVSRRPIVEVAVVVPGQRGVWAGGVSLAALSDAGGVRTSSARGYGVVTDSRGLVVAHQADRHYVEFQSDFSSVPAVAAALAGRSGAGEWHNPIDGGDKLGAYLPLSPWGWAVIYATPRGTALAPARALRSTITVASILVALVLAAISLALVKRLTKPLRALTQASTGLAAGDLSQRVAASGTDEVAQVAGAFNRMADVVAADRASLERHAAQLEAANRELDAFAYSVAHDLRAPLRSIDGFSSVLSEDYGDALGREGRATLERVRAAAHRMARQIDDLLALSRVGKAALTWEPVPVSQLAATVAGELAAANPGRRVRFEVEPGLVTVGDRALLRLVLENLLGNSWKFTARTPDPVVELVHSEEHENGYVVRDNGAGFDPRYAGKLFGAFQRLHHEAEFPGTGIGLAIVQRIIHRHGGEVWATGAVGLGASIGFSLGPPPGAVEAVPSAPMAGEQPVDTSSVSSPAGAGLVDEPEPSAR